MPDLIVTENMTLDGVIEATEGWFDAAGGEDDVSDVEAALQKQGEAADALLLGRVTFEQMRGDWPLQTDDTTGITDYLNDVSKYVLSNTLQDPEWERTAVLGSVDDIRALKSRTGGDIVTTGSIRLVRELIAAGLVDEYRLFTYPVVLGRGQRLFADATEVPRLHLVESQPFRSVSDGADLARFYSALLSGRLLSRARLSAMEDTVATDSPTVRDGLGIFAVKQPDCGRVWGHEGGIQNYTTLVQARKDGSRIVVISLRGPAPPQAPPTAQFVCPSPG
jgi:dihydrofolate reductase